MDSSLDIPRAPRLANSMLKSRPVRANRTRSTERVLSSYPKTTPYGELITGVLYPFVQVPSEEEERIEGKLPSSKRPQVLFSERQVKMTFTCPQRRSSPFSADFLLFIRSFVPHTQFFSRRFKWQRCSNSRLPTEKILAEQSKSFGHLRFGR